MSELGMLEEEVKSASDSVNPSDADTDLEDGEEEIPPAPKPRD